jgi:hypothetical protein
MMSSQTIVSRMHQGKIAARPQAWDAAVSSAMRFPHGECCRFATMLGNCTIRHHSDRSGQAANVAGARDSFDINYRNSLKKPPISEERRDAVSFFGDFRMPTGADRRL